MKLPDDSNLYSYNENLDDLHLETNKLIQTSWYLSDDNQLSVTDICNDNIIILDKMRAIILHLELVTDEILKLQGREIDTDIQMDKQ